MGTPATRLEYATPSAQRPPPLWPALLVALGGSPAATVCVAAVAYRLAMGWWPTGAWDVAAFGAVFGGSGGVLAAAGAVANPARALRVAVAGCVLVAAAAGALLYVLAPPARAG